MVGYELYIEDAQGQEVVYWINSSRLFYKEVIDDNENTIEYTVSMALDELYGRITQLEGQQSPATFSVDIDSETGNWIINNVLTDHPSKGDTPSIEVRADGYWYVDGVKQEAVPARGPQGEQGTPGATVYVTSEGGGSGIAGKGSFNDALDYYDSLEDGNIPFSWILVEEDPNTGDTITKIIYHIGNRDFIDALGAIVVGSADGITGS